MKYQLRDYQQQASDNAVMFFQSQRKSNGILVLPTGSGKSIVIADIAYKLGGNILVLQPNKEIVEQNYAKLRNYGVKDCSIYSASCGSKEISKITFGTIGSVMSKIEDFDHFKYIIIDECHTVNAIAGQYKTFIERVPRRVLGLTATPYRLSASLQYLDKDGRPRYRPNDEAGSDDFDKAIMEGMITPQNMCILKFLTRTRPRVFDDVVYQVDIGTLLKRGYLARLRYFDLSPIDQQALKRNSTGMDFDDKSLREEYKSKGLTSHLIDIVRRLQRPKDGIPRKGILVFTRYIDESEALAKAIDGVAIITGSTKKKEREQILAGFKTGKVKVVSNVGVLTTGFDYPELDTIVIARPTMSLALYYQIVGRAIRPHPDKESAWIVDLGGNIKRFGRVEDLHLIAPQGRYQITGHVNGMVKVLTNVFF